MEQGSFSCSQNLVVLMPVPPILYPLLVTFTDIADPKTVTRVDSANLAATFGPGYALTSITLEITDEPVTEGQVQKARRRG
jgi:hypothetical protein